MDNQKKDLEKEKVEIKQLVEEMKNDPNIPKITEHLVILKSGFSSKKIKGSSK